MSIYLGRLQSVSKLDVVITAGINMKDYQSNPIYDKAVFYTGEQVLSGALDGILKKAVCIEVSHLGRQLYREIGIYLRRLFDDAEHIPDIYIPDNPCITSTIVGGERLGNPKKAFVPTQIDDGIDLDIPDPMSDYDIPDEDHEISTKLMVAKDGTILAPNGDVDYVQTVSCISYGKLRDYTGAYIEIRNDDDYVIGQSSIPRRTRLNSKGGLPDVNRYLWSDLNLALLSDYSITYIKEAKQIAILYSDAVCTKYRDRNKGYVFYDSNLNVKGDFEILGTVESIPITNVVALLYARLACRNLAKHNPRVEAYLHFAGCEEYIEWDDNKQALKIGNYTLNYNAIKNEVNETIREESKMQSPAITVKIGRPLHAHDFYVADFAKMGKPLCQQAAIMHVDTHPMESVFIGKYNTKLHTELYVDFSGAVNERELASKLFDYLEEFVANGNDSIYDVVYIEPGTATASVFEHVAE